MSKMSHAAQTAEPTRLIYVDNKMVLENEISSEDLLRMADQPDKFRLSKYL